MRIWCDILSPKQLYLFTSIGESLRQNGYEVYFTSRRYVQLDKLIDETFGGLRIPRIGEWGGGNLIGKLRASAERTLLLLDHIADIDPDLCFSSGSPEAARICYGLGIPHLMVSDTPHSPVNLLTAPISKAVLTPWIIPKDEWLRAGARKESIHHYRALDPCFWLRDFKPDDVVLDRLGLEERGYALVRMPESMAAYLKTDDEKFLELVKLIAQRLGDKTLVVSCRYPEQLEAAHRLLQLSNVKVVGELLPGPSLIYYSTLFLGGGGTMTQEAALLGVPTISIYPQRLPTVLEFLRNRGLVIRCETMEDLMRALTDLLMRIDVIRDEWEEKAKGLWEFMENPMNVLLQVLRESF